MNKFENGELEMGSAFKINENTNALFKFLFEDLLYIYTQYSLSV